MNDRIAPQLAKEGDFSLLTQFITDDRYVMEQKLDGNRVLIVAPGEDCPPLVLTRNGNAYTKKIPTAVRNFRFGSAAAGFMPAGSCVFDGELVRNGSDDYTYWVFDLPTFQGESNLPLSTRRQALELLVGGQPNGTFPFTLVPQARTKDEKIRLVETAMTSNFEGLLVKKADSVYIPGGRTTDWLKLKFVTTADVIVTGVRTDGKDSVDLGLVDPEKMNVVPVGRSSLIGKEKGGTISVGDVIEVRYLYTGAGGRLYQPTILRRRTDKTALECTTDQLKHVNKAVMAALP